MLTASKNGRTINAMVMTEPVDRCLGIVQCALPGCEAHLPLIVIDDTTVGEQVEWFLNHHECRAPIDEAVATKQQRERAANIARIRKLAAEEPRENLRARQLAGVVPQLLEVADQLRALVVAATRGLEAKPERLVEDAPALARTLRKAVALLWPSGIK